MKDKVIRSKYFVLFIIVAVLAILLVYFVQKGKEQMVNNEATAINEATPINLAPSIVKAEIEEPRAYLLTDFEDGTVQGWTARGGNEKLSIILNYANSGSYSLHVSNREEGWNGAILDISSYMEVGKTYELSGWVRLPEGTQNSKVSMVVQRTTKDQTYYELVKDRVIRSDAWFKLIGSYALYEESSFIGIYFEAYDDPTLEFYLDDIQITPTNTPPPIKIQEDILPLKDAFDNHFLLGTALLAKELADVNGPDAKLIMKHFNSVTPGNELKWDATEPLEGEFNFARADQIIQFAEENGIASRGHTLIWHSQTPNWVFYDDEGNLASKEQLYERMKLHIDTVVGRYKGIIYAWDVVNEVIDDGAGVENGLRNSLWYQIAGEEYIEKAFEFAHEADSEAILYINDYNTHQPQKRDRLYHLVKRLQEKGVPVHGVGHQTHINIQSPSLTELDQMIEKFRDLNVEQQITELDMSIYTSNTQAYEQFPQELQSKQASRYKDIFEIFKKHDDVITSVIFWGKDDANTWLRTFPVTRHNWPLLFDERLQAKPAYWALVDPTYTID